jgi:serine/threonine-protein kinase
LIVAALALGSLVAIDTTQELTLAAQRRAEKARLTERLESGLALERKGRYAEARVLLGRLGDGGHADLRRKIDQAVANLDLIEALDSITLSRVSIADGGSNVRSNKADADRKYAEIFSKAGLGSDRDEPDAAALRIRASTIRSALVAALDDWAACTTDSKRRAWVLAVCRFADPDPSGWREKMRDPAFWNNRDKLAAMAEPRSDATSSLELQRALADRMDDAGIDTVPFRTELQQSHADSFVANVSLADALRERDPAEAVRYYQAAVAIRPLSALAHNNLAAALASLNRKDEAIEHYQLALAIDPELAVVHYNLGQSYLDGGDAKRAVASFRRAVEIDSEYAGAAKALEEALKRSSPQSDMTPTGSGMPKAAADER